MLTVDIEEAKTQLLGLVDQAARGEPFIVAEGGKPLVQVVPVESRRPRATRTGFMAGETDTPDDFDEMVRAEIEEMVYGE